jgi:hypothetical protein
MAVRLVKRVQAYALSHRRFGPERDKDMPPQGQPAVTIQGKNAPASGKQKRTRGKEVGQ